MDGVYEYLVFRGYLRSSVGCREPIGIAGDDDRAVCSYRACVSVVGSYTGVYAIHDDPRPAHKGVGIGNRERFAKPKPTGVSVGAAPRNQSNQ